MMYLAINSSNGCCLLLFGKEKCLNYVKKYRRLLFLTFIIFMSLNTAPAYSLGDYHYLWVSKTIPVDTDNNRKIQIGCEAYCFWDRVISIEDNTTYVFVVNDHKLEVETQNIQAVKKNDHKITISGMVTLKTVEKYKEQDAIKMGLVSAGFIKPGNPQVPHYYYKTIKINHNISV